MKTPKRAVEATAKVAAESVERTKHARELSVVEVKEVGYAMGNAIHTRILLIVITLFSLPPALAAPSFVCGANPAQNTKIVQQAINGARRVDTIVLPTGVCVLAKCEVGDPNANCNGVKGAHSSALYIGNRLNSQLDIVGDASGTSVLKLDPNPPRKPDERHPYCGDTHVVPVEKISHVTFCRFTIDGSHGSLPDDTRECPKQVNGATQYQGFAEHMHGLYLKNAEDIEVVDMQLVNAHGDGLNLIARPDLQPLTRGITVRDTDFVGNKRSGIGFQRNVSDVFITGNSFRNSGTDQDLDMESTGKGVNEGPTRIDINHNRFERAKAEGAPASGIAVTLGAGNTELPLEFRLPTVAL